MFNFASVLDENPLGDLIYKAILSGFLCILFFYLASIGDENGGAYIKEAVESGSRVMYWNVVGAFGILFFLGGMWFKNIDYKITNDKLKRLWSYPSTIIQKIAQDILVSAFGLSSAFVGYTLFYYVLNFNTPKYFWTLTLIVSWGTLSISFLTAELGVLVYLLKMKDEHKIAKWLKQRCLLLVIVTYPALSLLFWWFFWHYNP